MTTLRKTVRAMNENETTNVSIPRKQLAGWPTTPPLTGTDWRNFAESLPASEFATTLLFVADGIDKADGTGWYAREGAK